MPQFTLVRHSGYSVAGNSAFDDAVEVCEFNLHQAYSVRAVGGLIFETRAEAIQARNDLNHPLGSGRGATRARGHFSSLRLAGAEIYVPEAASQ